MTSSATINRVEPVHLMIADGHRLVADALAVALDLPGFHVTIAADPTETAAAVVEYRPDVVILDLELDDAVNTITDLTTSGARVVALATGDDINSTGAAVEAGADVVLLKTGRIDDLHDALDRLAAGDDVYGQTRRVQLLDAYQRARTERKARLAPFEQLTRREHDVLAGLYDGLAADAIAERDYVSLPTVRSQIRGILQKLGVNSQLAAVASARNAGWSNTLVAA